MAVYKQDGSVSGAHSGSAAARLLDATGAPAPMNALPRARLAGYREQSGAIRFRISSSPNLRDTVEELKRRVPSWARRYDNATREWSVNADYRTVLEALFVNTPSALEPAGSADKRGKQRDPFGSEARYTSRARMLWFLIGLAVIGVAGAMLWSRTPRPTLTDAAAQTAVAQTLAAQPAAAPLAQTPLAGRVNSLANLRAAPGTDAAILRKASASERVTAVGKYRADDNYWWLELEGGLWVRSDLVVRDEAGELPLDLSLLPEVDLEGNPVAASVALSPASVATAAANSLPGAVSTGPVLFIVDGNTIHVNLDGREVRVRYIGIDTPERDEVGYQSAVDANRALVEGHSVRMVADAENMDAYGRLLRYVYVDHDDNLTTAELLVNRVILEQGWAELLTIAPNTTHAAEFGAALATAQANGVGLWK